MRTQTLYSLVSAGVLATAVASADASTIATIQTRAPGTIGQTADANPVVTAVLTRPGTFNGKTYTNWAFLIDDGTGALEVYAPGAVMTGLGYTPAVGDMISVTGRYQPFHQIPSLDTLTAISAISSGNPIPGPLVCTIADVKHNPLPLSIGGHMVQLDNITITGQTGTFGITDSPPTAMISDATGTMKLYYWPSSFSLPNQNLFGQSVPTTPVSMTGFVSVYGTVPEFHPIAFVPEPTLLAAIPVCAGALMLRRRK